MTSDRDERLAVLLDDLSRQQRQGQVPDFDAIARDHPDLTGELRQLWAAAQMAEALARPANDATGDYALPPVATRAPTGEGQRLPRVFGDYVLLRELGRGGMGVVYAARQQSLNRIVALKMVLRGDLASANDRARFRAEAEAAARLVHPNIVTVHEVGEHDGQPFFAMQFVEGATLAERVARGPLLPREAARIVAAVSRAVDHAHRHGVLHRDLKPSNILLEGDEGSRAWEMGSREWGVGSRGSGLENRRDANAIDSSAPYSPFPTPHSPLPKVMDFGLAKLVGGAGSLTQTGAILGTPAYMAPEQARAEKHLSPAADVYSLGVILYECITGRPPFQAATSFETILLVTEQDPVPPRLLNPGVPRDLETICLKCLHKSPSRRYASAADLATDLEAFVSGERVTARLSGLASFFDRAFQETHHAAVLENWGLLWMWHSLVIAMLCLATQVLAWTGWGSHAVYLILWSVGLIAWGAIFWQLRHRGGPVRFVERQIAHAWMAGVCASIGMFILEVLMDQDALKFSPLLAVAAGMVFLFKAGVLAGLFYIAALAMFATAVLMARFPDFGVLLFGIVSAACFFFPGLKYHRQRLRGLRLTETDTPNRRF